MCRRWTDAVVEGFLYSTLVDGSGLVLTELSADGKRKDMGVRPHDYFSVAPIYAKGR